MKFLVNLAIGSTVLALSASAAAADPAHVTCVGDSITAGAGTTNPATDSYPAQLQGLLGTATYAVQNDGHSGATLLVTGDLPYTTTSEYTASGTFAAVGGDVVIQLGTNDSKPQNWDTHKGTFEADCETLVAHYQGLTGKPRVWVNLPPPAFTGSCCSIRGDVIKDEVLPLLKQCAAAKGATTIDVFTPLSSQGAHFSDGVHPDNAGALIIAQTVKAAITKLPTLTLAATGSTFPLPSPVTLTSTATAAYGKVEQVELFEGNTSLAKSTTSPFSLSATLPAGPHTLYAVATETGGRSAKSTDVTVTVVEAPPPLDAGLPTDAGADAQADAGATPVDAGSSSGSTSGGPADASTAANDAGYGGGTSGGSLDAGGAVQGSGTDATDSSDDSGCNVSRSSGLATTAFGLGLILGAAALLRRRKRR